MQATAVPEIEIEVQGVKFHGANLKQAIEQNFEEIVKTSRITLGNAAGYRLGSVYLNCDGLFRNSCGNNNNYWSTSRDGADCQKGTLVIESTGLDLAHRKADVVFKRHEIALSIPLDAEPIVIRHADATPDFESIARQLLRIVNSHQHACCEDDQQFIESAKRILK